MRVIRGHEPGEIVDFIPTAYKNALDDSPVTVRYKVPTEKERRKLIAYGNSIRVDVDGDGKPTSFTTRSDEHVDRQAHVLTERVVSVSNYTGRAGPIETGEQLGEHGEGKIVDEVFDEIMGNTSLTVDEQKKSSGSSDSKDPATQDSSETVTTAGRPVTTGKETATGQQTRSTLI